MTSPAVQVERRVGQRFAFLLPVSFRDMSTGVEGRGVTHNLSSRGVFFFSDTPLQGPEIELTLNMPSEITLGESMRVRCRGQILRVTKPSERGGAEAPAQVSTAPNQTKFGVAVRFEGYEYLAETAESSATQPRMSVLHVHHDEEDRPLGRARGTPPLG